MKAALGIVFKKFTGFSLQFKALYNPHMIGKLLDGRYRIKVELAEGGFSQTYLAEDTRLPKHPKCVVKHLNPTIDDPIFTQKALELFKAEAETLQELGRHDRIPQLYAYFQENKEFFCDNYALSTNRANALRPQIA